jgi:hypothetical protein
MVAPEPFVSIALPTPGEHQALFARSLADFSSKLNLRKL